MRREHFFEVTGLLKELGQIEQAGRDVAQKSTLNLGGNLNIPVSVGQAQAIITAHLTQLRARLEELGVKL